MKLQLLKIEMKALLIATLITFPGIQVKANSEIKNASYCAEMKDGILVITNDGAIANSDITLESGVTIKLNGEVLLSDGSKFVLSDGDCIDKDGNLLITSPDNDRSAKLLEKLGLRFEEMLKLSNDSEEVKLFGTAI